MLATGTLTAEMLFFAVTAVYSFAFPVRFAAQLGLDASGSAGTNEIRAQYGGFFAAAAAFDLSALAGVHSVQFGLLLGLTIFGGLIFGRTLAILMNRGISGYTPTIKSLLLIDSIGFLASWYAVG